MNFYFKQKQYHIAETNFELCSGLPENWNCHINHTIQEYCGNQLIQRSKDCKYICRDGKLLCQSCLEIFIKQEVVKKEVNNEE